MECSDTKATPASVPFVNLLANRITTNSVVANTLSIASSFEVKDFTATGISTLNGVISNTIDTKSIDVALVGSSPVQYSRIQYYVCENAFSNVLYSIPQPAINVFGPFKGPVNGLGTTPQNYGNFDLEYAFAFTSSVANTLSVSITFGSSTFGQCDLAFPSGTHLVSFKVYMEASGGSSTTQEITYYSTMTGYTTGLIADFNEGGAITLNDLTLPMRPTFNIRSNQAPASWSATRRKYIFNKI